MKFFHSWEDGRRKGCGLMPARSDGLGGWEDRPGGGAKIAPMKRKGAGSFPRARIMFLTFRFLGIAGRIASTAGRDRESTSQKLRGASCFFHVLTFSFFFVLPLCLYTLMPLYLYAPCLVVSRLLFGCFLRVLVPGRGSTAAAVLVVDPGALRVDCKVLPHGRAKAGGRLLNV